MKKLLSLVVLALLTAFVSGAQVVTSSPSPLQENSTNVKIYFNAAGTPLASVPATSVLYAHTGCFLTNGSEWFNAPSWGTNTDKYKLAYDSQLKVWVLDIGDIRSYYGVTDPNVHVTKLGLVFRSGDTKTQTEDLFVEVFESGLQVSLQPSTGTKVFTSPTAVTFTVATTETANITLSVNGTQVATQNSATSLTGTYTFSKVGDYTVTATATDGSSTVSRSINYVYISGSSQVNYPGGNPTMGAVANSDGSVTFCLAAPAKSNVMLVGSWNDYAYTTSQLMNYQDVSLPSAALTGNQSISSYEVRYFWTTVNGLSATEQYLYFYIVDGTTYVADPYAKLILDPAYDKYIDASVYPNLPDYPSDYADGNPVAIYQGNLNSYNWKVTDFKRPEQTDLIIYEMLFRDFTGTEGKADGNGTVQLAIDKMNYLKSLNINAVELLPIMEFNGNLSWGYNTNFYMAPDKAYGTPDDYKEFIDLCHQNGIAVILDIVFNQSDWLHPWYQMYGGKKNNPFYNSTYSENGAPHAYSVLNDWNQDHPLVQQQWEDALKYWLTEYKVDGFRFDLVKGLGDNNSYGNASDGNTNKYNASRVARMKALQEAMESVSPGAYFINENLAGAQEENEMAATGQMNWANVNNAGCQFAMGYSSDSDLNRMYAPSDGGRAWGSTVSYLESHDEQRLAFKQNKWGVSGVKGNVAVSMQRLGSAAAQMILVPGAHMIWQFSEMGNAENTKENNGEGGGNLTGNKIVNWNLLNDPDHYELYQSYCRLIYIRSRNPELFVNNGATFTEACGANNWSGGRYLYLATDDKSKELYTVINPNITGTITMNSVPFASTDNSNYEIIQQSYGSEGSASFNAVAGTISVPANCYVVVANKGVDELTTIKGDNNSGLTASGRNGLLSIESAPGHVEVYSIDGRRVAGLNAGESVSVQPGIYILHCGSTTQKIAVN